MHWLNAVAVIVLMTSGWQIYNASPLLDFKISRDMTLGGWLGGALQWHFAAMWLLVANGVAYLLANLLTQRWRRQFFPLSMHELIADFFAALKGQLTHAVNGRYNAVQRLAYLLIMADVVVLILSGLVLWKPVQFDLLRVLLGDYDMARWIHFYAMAVMATFLVIHLAMVVLVPRSLLTMLRGR